MTSAREHLAVQDRPYPDDAAFVRSQIEDAIKHLWKSMEASSSMLRRDFCLRAGEALRRAAALDALRQDDLLAYAHRAMEVASAFSGDGSAARRLYDELGALVDAMAQK